MTKELFSVCALVINNRGEILCCSRRNKPDDLGLPGGKIDPGETPDQAMLRELKEETGITAIVFHNIFERGEETADGRMSRTYYVSKYEGEPASQEEGITVSWQKPSRLLEENCSFREFNRQLLHTIMVS